MSFTSYRTWTTSETVTKALLDEQIRDNGNYLKGQLDGIATSTVVRASGNLTLTTSSQDIPGATSSLPAGTYLINGVFDMNTGAGTGDNGQVGVGALDVGGTELTGNATFVFYYVDPVRLRASVSQAWTVALGGTTTAKLVGRKGGGSGSAAIQTSHTAMTVTRIA